jgi:hypothetical protein
VFFFVPPCLEEPQEKHTKGFQTSTAWPLPKGNIFAAPFYFQFVLSFESSTRGSLVSFPRFARWTTGLVPCGDSLLAMITF